MLFFFRSFDSFIIAIICHKFYHAYLFQGFDAFINLPHTAQSALLKHNADMIVSLRGAVFFEKRKGGLDQV